MNLPTPEQIAGRLKQGIEHGLQAISFETIYAWIYSKGKRPVISPYVRGFLGFQRFASLSTSKVSSSV